MFLTRKIGSILRGKATLPQILTACVLGGMLGFVPGFFLPGDLGGGFLQAPGLILALFGLVLVVDANLAIFGLVTLGAKLLSLVLLPLSFGVGRWLLEGPLEGLFRTLVNAPVTAYFGLERYATSGGLVVGFAVGLLTGLLLWKALHALRLKFASLEEGSERFQKFTSRKSTKVLTWIFLGKGKGKLTWREVAENDKRGKGVRILGVLVVLVLGAALWFTQRQFGSAWLHQQAQTGLTYWNGATVDLAGAELDLAGGRVAFDRLAMADAESLVHDVFRARSLEFDVATSKLLAGRFVIEKLVSGEPKSGEPREKPGERVTPKDPPPPPVEGPGKGIEEYVQEALVWKERLAKAAEWLQKFTGEGSGGPAGETDAQREERIGLEKDKLGLVHVIATHLVAAHPRVTIGELAFDGVSIAGLAGELVDIKGTNLSSNPALAEAPATLSLTSRSGKFGIELRYDPKSPGRAGIDLRCAGLPTEALGSLLKDSPVSGGTLDLRLAGAFELGREGGPWIDLPLVATLRNTTLAVGGKSATLEALEVPLGLRGPLRSPKVSIDGEQLQKALVAAGRAELANEVRARADALLGVPGAGAALSGVIEGTKTPEQLLEEAKQKAEAEAKARLEAERKKAEEEAKKRAEEEIKKRLPGGIGDILKRRD
ncbi:MAG: hypothetical protein IT457_00950 [Planctomycetes bacterium]|nr:hypothetical protein [Planctomycetota bacterium]